MEKKARLHPLKKKKIYQDLVDITTMAKREQMKKLILSEKTNWSLLMSETKEEDFASSSIDSRQGSELKVELNTSNVAMS